MAGSTSARSADGGLVLISAWNDSGGGFTHRLFDGHSGLRCWPFELQLGTEAVDDGFADWLHKKYRWPEFSQPLSVLGPERIFDEIIDDELKSNLRDAGRDKFAAYPVAVSLDRWRARFAAQVARGGAAGRGDIVRAYLDTFFAEWKGAEGAPAGPVIGHCPNIVLDLEKIMADFPAVRMIHVFRSPLAGLADMRRRRPEVVTDVYCRKWALINTLAWTAARKYPERVRFIPYRALLTDREETLRSLCRWLGLPFEDVLLTATWDGRKLDRLPPFGGLPEISLDHEIAAPNDLSAADRDRVGDLTRAALELFDAP